MSNDHYENIRKMQPKLIKLIQGLAWDEERYRRLRESSVLRAEDTDEPHERANTALQDQEDRND